MKSTENTNQPTPPALASANGSGHVKHTPAPWKAAKGHDCDPERWCVVADQERQYLIAVIENGQPGDCCETEGATARLIAAAPELLQVVDAWSKTMQMAGVPAVENSYDPIESLLFRTRAARAKASGQDTKLRSDVEAASRNEGNSI